MTYKPTVCPFPPQAIGKQEVISDVSFPDPMLLKQYDREPEPDAGHWQLLADYRMIMRLPGDDSLWTITAPRGMMTDQASIPQRFWDWEGLAPFGPHSGPSIIHDLLFMNWNLWDRRGRVLDSAGQGMEFDEQFMRQRFDFANRVFWTGLVVKGVEVRKRMYHSVDLFGWEVFKDNPEPFDQAMNRWLGWLDD